MSPAFAAALRFMSNEKFLEAVGGFTVPTGTVISLSVWISSLAAGHLTLVPELKHALEEQGRPDIMIVVGGVVPPQDFAALRESGASAIFPPGTVIAEAAASLLEELNRRLGYAQREAAE